MLDHILSSLLLLLLFVLATSATIMHSVVPCFAFLLCARVHLCRKSTKRFLNSSLCANQTRDDWPPQWLLIGVTREQPCASQNNNRVGDSYMWPNTLTRSLMCVCVGRRRVHEGRARVYHLAPLGARVWLFRAQRAIAARLC